MPSGSHKAVPVPATGLRFPYTRVLLPRTRLAYVHLKNLLTDAKRDRAARISGYVAISLPEELLILYLLGGELINATTHGVRDGLSKAVPIARALEKVPPEPEYGEICFHEADEEQLDCMFASHVKGAEAWPANFDPSEPSTLFPYLMAMTFDGVLEIIADEHVKYLLFRDGAVEKAFLSVHLHGGGTLVERVGKLFHRDPRSGPLQVGRWPHLEQIPIQAPMQLVQAYRDLASGLVDRLVKQGRQSAPVIAELARSNLTSTYPVLDGLSFSDKPAKDILADSENLTAGIAAWIKEFMFTAVDHDAASPDQLLKELTWERRHMFQSAGLFDQVPWKVM